LSTKSRIATFISVLSVLGIAAPIAGAAATQTPSVVNTSVLRGAPVTASENAWQVGLQAALGGWQAGAAAAQEGYQAGATAAQAGLSAGLNALGFPVGVNLGPWAWGSAF
jgi:hypothetical protein